MNSPKPRSLNLRQALGLLCSGLTLIAGLIVCILYWQNLNTSLSAAFMNNLDRESRNLSIALSPGLVSEDRITLNLILSDWVMKDGIELVRVLGKDGQPLAETGSSRSDASRFQRHIQQDKKELGVLEIEYSLQAATATGYRSLSLGLITTALLSLLMGIAGYQAGARLANVIEKIRRQLISRSKESSADCNQPSAGRIHLATSRIPLEELSKLVELIDQQEQERIKENTKNEALNRFLLNQNKPISGTSTYHRCAMLYIEIQDLDILQTRLGAEELANCLSEYHQLLSQAAKLYNGRLDRYQGDGLVMTFGLNEPSDRDTLHCLFAAWLCINLVRNAQQQSSSSLTQVSFRCAAHWGPILLTPIQNEDDSGIQYSLIGDSLYWTSHLARRSEEFAILVSQTLIQELPEDTDLQWLDGPETQDLQGNSQANFWLSALPETSQTLIERQAQRILSMTAKT